jgi:COMPASS component BRE2
MAADTPREGTPSAVPQKRTIDDDHAPAVPSPLNPEPKKVHVDDTAVTREKRTKKESLKKRESKGLPDSARATPDPKLEQPVELAPIRYKLAHPKPTDFDPPRGPVFTPHHEVQDPDGRTIEFCETSDQ